MKKLFTFLVLAILLAGCATTSNESFLDEKIKCKKMADERIEKLRADCMSCGIHEGYSNYSPELDTCLINYTQSGVDSRDGLSVHIIEDIVSNKIIAEFYEDKDDLFWAEKKIEFNSQFDLYFGEDAE